MKRFNFFKYTTLGSKVHTSYFDYWFFKKLTQGEPVTPAIEGEGTNFELVTTNRKKLEEIKLKGDTTQNTLTGKNLMPLSVYDASDNRIMKLPTLKLTSGTYTISFNLESYVLGTGTTFPLQFALYDENNTAHNITILNVNSSSAIGEQTYTFTISYNTITSNNTCFKIPQSNYDAGSRIKISNIQIEAGSTATSYEPYCGGTASPNPDYPQDVNVVTGTQTLTITNGTDVQTYPITLGSIELCKIGTYQDYIYKEGDKWYTHKEVGSITYKGIENFVMFGNNSGFFIGNDEALAPTSATDIGTMAVKSNYYTNCLFNDIYTMNISYGISLYGATTTRHRICFRNKDISSASDFKTWLSTHNTTVYYALETPVNTEITDTTLISELNNILAEGHLTKGTNVLQTTATGTNLPTIIYVKTN